MMPRLAAWCLVGPSGQGVDRVFPAVVRLLAKGLPVHISDVARACGRPEEEVRRILHAGTQTGGSSGLGSPSGPRTTGSSLVAGRFTGGCLRPGYFVLILGERAVVESTCPETGTPIRVDLHPGAALVVDPPGAVVSRLDDATGLGDIRANPCDQGHFFASAIAAAPLAAKL